MPVTAELRFVDNRVALYHKLPGLMNWAAEQYLNKPRLQETVAEMLRDAGLPVS